MQICFASHNPAKLQRYQNLLKDFKVELLALSDFNITEKAPEPFTSSQENALYKAQTYAKIINMPVLAVDEEMRTNFLPEKLQPGVLVRRLGKALYREPTDQEVIDYWLQLIESHPHLNPEFYWDFSIVLFDSKSELTHFITVTQVNEVSSYVSKEWDSGYPMSTFMRPKGYGKIPCRDIENPVQIQIEQANFQPFLTEFPKWIKSLEEH